MDADKILLLIETVSRSTLTEFTYEEGNTRLTLKRDPGSSSMASVVEQVPRETAPVSLDPEEIITSPLVGTFYAAPAEDAEPFVRPGDAVHRGQVLGIVETMKLMNEIECDRDGVISAVLVENEQVVEYGQPLFRIR